METNNLRAPNSSAAFSGVWPAVALAIGVLTASILARLAWPGETAPFPFLWRDVALIHLLAALPLATLLALGTLGVGSRFANGII